jgi:hypothetical protein
MGADVRVLPRLLESEDSESALLGRYHSGIDRDWSLNRLSKSQKTNESLSRRSPMSTRYRQAARRYRRIQ